MNDLEIKSLVNRIITGMSTQDDEKILEDLIASGRLKMEDFEEINHLSENLVSHLIIDPPSRMDQRFYQMLDSKSNRKYRHIITFRTIALAASITLLIGFFGGYFLYQKENSQNQLLISQLNNLREEIVISKLDNKSTGSRLQAVGLTHEMSEVSEKICDALLFTINNDPSDNVRLASIEALIPLGNMEIVRHGLINAIPQQKSPLVLISLAEALKKIGASQSADQFQNQISKDMPSSISDAFEKDLHSILTDKI